MITKFYSKKQLAIAAGVSRTGEKLEKDYPDSESIKYGKTVAVMK